MPDQSDPSDFRPMIPANTSTAAARGGDSLSPRSDLLRDSILRPPSSSPPCESVFVGAAESVPYVSSVFHLPSSNSSHALCLVSTLQGVPVRRTIHCLQLDGAELHASGAAISALTNLTLSRSPRPIVGRVPSRGVGVRCSMFHPPPARPSSILNLPSSIFHLQTPPGPVP
jgi:hypothetical protein